MWQIALYGTNTYCALDEDSEIALSELNTTNPMEDENWLKLNILGMGMKYRQINETGSRIGGISVHYGGAVKKRFDCKLAPVKFPDDMNIIVQLKDVLLKPYLYLYKGTYVFDAFEIHKDDYALGVACIMEIEDDYEGGQKIITLIFDTIKPTIA